MALSHFEIDGIRGFGDVEKLQPAIEIAKRFKELVLTHFPNAGEFLLGKGVDSDFLQCYVGNVSVTLFTHPDEKYEMFRYHFSYSELERLKGWMLYGGFCFNFDELADEMKAIKEGLQRRGFIPVEVAI